MSEESISVADTYNYCSILFQRLLSDGMIAKIHEFCYLYLIIKPSKVYGLRYIM